MCIFLCYAILSFDISNLDLFFASNGCLIKIKSNTLLCDMTLYKYIKKIHSFIKIIACNAHDSIMIKW